MQLQVPLDKRTVFGPIYLIYINIYTITSHKFRNSLIAFLK